MSIMIIVLIATNCLLFAGLVISIMHYESALKQAENDNAQALAIMRVHVKALNDQLHRVGFPPASAAVQSIPVDSNFSLLGEKFD